ncbi:AAA family ATPase [Streptomyces sp. NPDC058441]|uniref:AAA family ATPase n=1 Tax=Streptomyces sp. NPDC058441 TaxID=3346502 RepID=UPI0036531444
MRSLVIGAGGFAQIFIDEDDVARGEEPFSHLPSVASAVQDVARALNDAGIQTGAPCVDPTAQEFRVLWAGALSAAAGQPLIVHFSGHGESQAGSLYLAVRDSRRGERLRATSVEVEALVKDAQAASSPVLFLLDVCQAGQAVTEQLVRDLVLTTRGSRRVQAPGVWVVGACAADETTQQAVFSRATTTVLRRLAEGMLDVSPGLEFVPVETFAAEVAREVARSGGLGQSVVRTPTDLALVDVPGFFPNPSFAPDAPSRFLTGVSMALKQLALAVDPGIDLLHFATRAAGNKRVDVCQFSGRAAQLEHIGQWLDDSGEHRERLLVVTGGPGTGKSALLGVTACLLHPELLPLRRQLRARLPGFDPRPEGRLVAVHARQLTTGKIIQSLCRQLSSSAPGAGPGHEGAPEESGLKSAGDARLGIDGLAVLARAKGPVTIVLDALDEASDPAEVVRDLIAPLVGIGEHEGVPGCRVMVGTRPWWEMLEELHDATASNVGALLTLDPVTDTDRKTLSQDLTEYLGQLLDEYYPVTTPRAVAERLAADAQTGAFLIASLFADHLTQQAVIGHPLSDDDIRMGLPCTITEVFDLHTQSLAADDQWFLTVLHILGQARGLGMPLDLLHQAAVLAHTATGADTDLYRTQEDTHRVVVKAAFYLRTAPDTDHHLLYRYFHQALNDHTATAVDPVIVYQALLASVPHSADGRRQWECAHPYLKRHAADHALAAGVPHLDQLLSDPGFLVHADPDGLMPYLHHAASDTAVHYAHIYRSTLPQHPRREDVSSRRGLLAVDAAAWHHPALAAALAQATLADGIQPARPVWATNSSAHPARLHPLEGAGGSAGAISAVASPHAPALAVAHHRGQLCVWDLETGKQLRNLDQSARALATVALPDGRTVALASSGGSAQVWDIGTGTRMSTLTGTVEALTALALPSGGALALTTDGTRARVWNLVTGQHQRFLSTRGRFGTALAAVVAPDGRALGITVDLTHKALVWDLETGRHLMTLNGHGAKVRTVAAVALPDGRAFAVTTSIGGPAIVWDLLTGKEHCRLHGLASAVLSTAAVVTADGQAFAVTADRTRSAAVWDLITGRRITTLASRHRAVDAVTAVALPDGRALAITTDRGGPATVWDLASSTHRRRPLPGHTSLVLSILTTTLPDGRNITLTSGDRVTFVWDIDTGELLHALHGHERYQRTELLELNGYALAQSTQAWEKARIWDLESGTCLNPRASVPGDPSLVHHALPGKPALAISTGPYGVRVEDRATGKIARTVENARVIDRPVLIRCTQSYEQWFLWDHAAAELAPVAVGSARTPWTEELLERWKVDSPLRHGPGPHRLWQHDRRPGQRRSYLRFRSARSDDSFFEDDHYIDDDMLNSFRDWAALEATEDRVYAFIDDDREMSWELTNPHDVYRLRRYTGSVHAMSVMRLPNGLPAAVIATRTGSIRVWDVIEDRQIGSAITLPQPAQVITATTTGIIIGFGSEIAYFAWNIEQGELALVAAR